MSGSLQPTQRAHQTPPARRQPRENFRDGILRGHALRRGVCGILVLVASFVTAPPAIADDASYAEERRTLEAARYLHEIEGDTAAASALLDEIGRTGRAEILVQALYLRARFLEEQGRTREAGKLYREALERDGLDPAQKQRLVTRLLALNPAAVRPFRNAGRLRGLPSRVFESPGAPGGEYVLAEEGGGATRLYRQDARGLLQPMNAALGPDEEILDADPARVLTRAAPRPRVILRRGPGYAPEVIDDRFTADAGALLSGGTEEFLLIGPQELRHMRGGQTLSTYPLPGPGCSWHPSAPHARQGVVFCPGEGLYRADFGRRAFTPLPLGGEPPSDILLAGEYLALRYLDHVEIRRGPAFDTFLWGFPSGLQDPMALGRSHVFLAEEGGPVRAFVLRSGQLDWQRDDATAALRVHNGELFVLTHARALLAVDGKGRLLYTYEPGWDGEEPLLLPGRDWVVVQNADGTRTRLNRELLRITGGSRDHLFRSVREHARRGETREALRDLDGLLALEAGNGTAWREKARLLAQTGAPRAEQTRAWTQASRSQGAAAWSADPAFAGLAAGLGASWVWKRQPGPRFFPVLTGTRPYAFYVENDNQTLVVLDVRNGTLKGSYRFPEPLDMKVSGWLGDTLAVSSPGRLYLMDPARGVGILAQTPLRSPVCHALMLPQGILFSDWNGNLELLNPVTLETVWETRLGRGGLLLAHNAGSGQVDVFEIEGSWHRVRIADGGTDASVRMPPGTITEVHAGRDFAYAGYNEGLVAAVEKNSAAIAWQRDMGEQIFSLAGRGDQLLLVGTASKRILNLNGRSGLVQSQALVPTHLFNRPLLASDGYWVGTTEPALEKRSLTHEVLQKFPLTSMPGTPARVGSGVAVSTQDGFIITFPAR